MDFENGKDADFVSNIDDINASDMKKSETDPANAALCVTSGLALLACLRINKAAASFKAALTHDAKNAEAYLGLLLVDNRLVSPAELNNTKKHFWESKYYDELCGLASPSLLSVLKKNRARIEADEESARLRLQTRREKIRAFIKKSRVAIIVSAVALVAVVAVISLANIIKNPISVRGVYYSISSDRSFAEVIGTTGRKDDIVIADSFFGKPVTSIRENAFYNCENIQSVVIGDNVTSIGNHAFYGCSGIASVVIGDSVTSIGDFAFFECDGIKSLEFGDNVKRIGSDAFNGCEGLVSISLVNEISYLGTRAFANCGNLQSVVIGDNVTFIGRASFSHCSALTSVRIPNSISNIEWATFYGCSALTSVTIPNSVLSIDNSAFFGCNNLTDIYYTGSKEDWNNIKINSYNEKLTSINVSKHYNYVPEE